MKLFDIISYNGGRGPLDGNPYWKKYTVPHYIYISLMLTLMGVGIGLVSLFICSAYLNFIGWEMFISYLREPLILALNLLPCVLLVWFFYFLTGRAWSAFGLSAAVVFVFSLINYYKIRIRSEAFLFSDMLLFGEAAGILGRYNIEITGRALSAAAALVFGLVFAAFLMRGRLKNAWVRVVGSVLTAMALITLTLTVYQSGEVYTAAKNNSVDYNVWSDLATYVSKGFVYPFLHSSATAVQSAPEGYSDSAAQEILSRYADEDMPEEKKVNVISVMFEAFTDLSEHPEIGVNEEVYAPFHELMDESLHGHLNVNIFGGGTVNTERNFLTGYYASGDYRSLTNSHVWYLRSQGYRAEGYHAGDAWFYNRQNVELNLGMESYKFMEDYDGATRLDSSFFPILASQYAGRDRSAPYFNFSVTYQNHGAYASDRTYEESFLSRDGKSDAAYNILNNYLHGVADTTRRMKDFIDSLRDDPEPVAVIFFGDHMPWLGDGNFVLNELGINIDLSTEEGFYNYYNTPWIIWANDAAKRVSDGDFTGEGGRVSSAYLMNILFRELGTGGSAWLNYNDYMLDRMEIANTGSSIYRIDGKLYTSAMLEGEGKSLVSEHKIAEYYMKRHFLYRNLVK